MEANVSSQVTDISPSLMDVQAFWEWYMKKIQIPGQAHGSKGYFDAIKVDHEKAYSCGNDLLNMPSLNGKKILEVACGIGLDTVEFARHGADVTSIDISPMALDLASKNLKHNGFDARLEQADAEELPFDANSFDVVVARGILMFTPNDQRIVNEIHRVLTPGGTVQALLHKRFSWYAMMARLSGANLVHPEGDPPINRLYTVKQARRMFGAFSSRRVSLGRLPYASKRGGLMAQLFNNVVVPATKILPDAMVRPFGYYIIMHATK